MSETPSGPKRPTRDEISEMVGRAIENMEPVSQAEAEAEAAKSAEIDARVAAQNDDLNQDRWEREARAMGLELMAARAQLARTEMSEGLAEEFEAAELEAKRRFPDVVSLRFDPETNEIVDFGLHDAGRIHHEQWHQAQKYIEENIKPLAKRVVYGDKTDQEVAAELVHNAVHKYPNVFSFVFDESGNITAFKVKYDTKKNTARTIEAAKLYCKHLYEELATLDHGLFPEGTEHRKLGLRARLSETEMAEHLAEVAADHEPASQQPD
jgi:hypothetical protein